MLPVLSSQQTGRKGERYERKRGKFEMWAKDFTRLTWTPTQRQARQITLRRHAGRMVRLAKPRKQNQQPRLPPFALSWRMRGRMRGGIGGCATT